MDSRFSWDDVRLFLAVAEAGSLSRAARALRIGQPTVSRRLAELEYRLGYTLFRRSASGVGLTAEGERLLPAARGMTEWAGEIGRASESAKGTGVSAPSGIVRIAAAPGVAFDFLAPFAASLRVRYPDLRVEALSTVHYLDLARGEADLALRSRPPQSDDLRLLATLEHRNAAFVSKDYAERLAKRVTARASQQAPAGGLRYADVDWLAWAPPYDTLPPNPQLEALIPGFRPAFTSDNFLVLWRAMEAGLGAMVLGDMRHRFTRPSLLVPLPLDLGPHARSQLHLVSAKRGVEIPRVRLVAELITEELAAAQQAQAQQAPPAPLTAARSAPGRSGGSGARTSSSGPSPRRGDPTRPSRPRR